MLNPNLRSRALKSFTWRPNSRKAILRCVSMLMRKVQISSLKIITRTKERIKEATRKAMNIRSKPLTLYFLCFTRQPHRRRKQRLELILGLKLIESQHVSTKSGCDDVWTELLLQASRSFLKLPGHSNQLDDPTYWAFTVRKTKTITL